MKRPSGIGGPTPPTAPAAHAAPPATGATATPRNGRPKVRRDRPRPDATTEPIPIQSAAAASAPPVAQTADEASSAIPQGLTPAQARKQLRAARRARKQYERDEVKRFTWRSRRRRRIWLASIGTVLALVAFVAVGTFSPIMALRTIEVVGTSRIPADRVQSALAGQLGTPLPLIDPAEIKADLAEFRLIRSYVTESRPPDTLVVRIVERNPVGLVPAGASFELVDAAGVVIERSTERPPGFPIIQSRAGVGTPGFEAAAAVVTALPEGIRSQLDTVTAATKDDVTLTLAGGARVVWGSPEKSEYKAVVLQALMVSAPVGTVGEYDVSSPDSAVLR